MRGLRERFQKFIMNNNENNLTRTKRRKNCAKSLRTTVSCETGFENGKEKMFVLCAVRIAECAGQGRETKPFPCTIRPFNLATPLQEKEKTNRNRLKEKEWILKIFNIFRGKKIFLRWNSCPPQTAQSHLAHLHARNGIAKVWVVMVAGRKRSATMPASRWELRRYVSLLPAEAAPLARGLSDAHLSAQAPAKQYFSHRV